MLGPTTILLLAPSFAVKAVVLYIFTIICIIVAVGSRYPDPVATVATYGAFIIAICAIFIA